MSLPSASFLLEIPGAAVSFLSGAAAKLLLSPGSQFSLASLFTALCVAVLWLGISRKRRRNIRLKVLLRALFPRRLTRSASSRADVAFFLFNVFLAGLLFGWAILSYHLVCNGVHDGLVAMFGTSQPSALPALWTTGALTVALFLAHDLGYYIDHYLSHRIPFLWEFHKVHHTAEVLSPLTNFRVHPVDSVLYYNILAIVMGTTGALVNYGFGKPVDQFTIANSNVLVLAFTYLLTHLQHTHFWIAFTGLWGRLILSPAHHQVHHSVNPIHFNKNLGSSLGVWDWMFGTLYVPSRKRERLTFGVEPKQAGAHSLSEGLVTPVFDAFAHLKPLLPASARRQESKTGDGTLVPSR